MQYFANKGSKRSLFVGLDGGYHGDTLAAMSVGNIPSYHGLFHQRYNKQLFANAPYCYRCPVGKDKATCNAECMESLEHILSDQGESIAACIFEPMIQGASGMRVYPPKVLKRIDAACKKYGVLTIADEIAVGFGRTGKMFACEHAGIVPDIMCVAKGLTGGYLPLAATIVKEHIYGAFCGDFASGKELNHGHTFTGNPLAAAAACTTLSIFDRMNIPASLDKKSASLQKKVTELNDLECVGDIRGLGTIAAIELVADRKTKQPFASEKRIPFKIAQHALDHGLLIRPLGNVLYFVPAYIISEEQINAMVEQTKNSIKAIVYG
jgi:adenosylmethionine-8-amino-7-oxononanoate aminotransferase